MEIKEIKITGEEDVKSLLYNFQTQQEAGIIRVGGYFICGVYYKKDKWNFMFNDYTIYSPSDPDSLDNLTRHLSYYSKEGAKSGEKTELTIFSGIDQMCFEIRAEVMNGCVNALTKTKFMYGDREIESNLPKIILEIKKDLGKVVDFGHGDKNKGILIGLESTMEDYYYIYLTADKKLHFDSCVGGYKVLEESDVPDELQEILNSPAEQRSILYKHFSDPTCTSICLLSI